MDLTPLEPTPLSDLGLRLHFTSRRSGGPASFVYASAPCLHRTWISTVPVSLCGLYKSATILATTSLESRPSSEWHRSVRPAPWTLMTLTSLTTALEPKADQHVSGLLPNKRDPCTSLMKQPWGSHGAVGTTVARIGCITTCWSQGLARSIVRKAWEKHGTDTQAFASRLIPMTVASC